MRRFAEFGDPARQTKIVKRHFIFLPASTLLLVLVFGCVSPTPPPILPPPTPAPLPTATALPPPTRALIATLVPLASPTRAPQPQITRIAFPPGGTAAMLQGIVAPNASDRYVLRALAGQKMTVAFSPAAENVTLQISGADGSVYVSGGAKFTSGTFALSLTQDYFISVISSRDAPSSYTLQITIPPLATLATSPQPRRITFAPGAISAAVQGSIPAGNIERLVLRAQAGQTMTVSVASNPPDKVIVVIFGADGSVLISDHATTPTWSGVLPTTQDYIIDLKPFAGMAADYTLTVTIPPK